MNILHTNKENLVAVHKNEHEPYEYIKHQVTLRKPGMKTMVAFYEIPPMKANYPLHSHLTSEEVFYILEGCGTLETLEGNVLIQAGDIVVCPCGEGNAHRIVNTGDQPLRYLDVDTVSDLDLVEYPASKKIGVIRNGSPSRFYRKDDDVDYYLGE